MEVKVEAIKDIYSTVRMVQRKVPGEQFTIPEALALQLRDLGLVKLLEDVPPKPEGALNGGPTEQPVSSSLEAPVSPQCNPSTLPTPTKKAGAKRSR